MSAPTFTPATDAELINAITAHSVTGAMLKLTCGCTPIAEGSYEPGDTYSCKAHGKLAGIVGAVGILLA